jgi:hypothetical protein
VREVVRVTAAEAMPHVDDALRRQGIPNGAADLGAGLHEALETARRLFDDLADPVGIVEEVTHAEFDAVYAGEGCNPPETPLPEIAERAGALALFAATLGPALSERVGTLFHEHDLAVGYLLDTFASAAADDFADRLARFFAVGLRQRGLSRHHTRVLPYSPGYCGWHVSGQARLFARLRPEEIGITLNDSYLMTPLKSVSGVLVSGDAAAHRFRADFPFCSACVSRECRDRLVALHKEALDD